MRVSTTTASALLGLVVLMTTATVSGDTFFVDWATGDDNNNAGTDWPIAFRTPQRALQQAIQTSGSHVIQVAQGTYFPDEGPGPVDTDDPAATFDMLQDVTILGGFAGPSEPDPNARDPVLYETILSGDIEQDDPPSPDLSIACMGEPGEPPMSPFGGLNSEHILTFQPLTLPNLNPTAIVDGFTIMNGNAVSGGDFGMDSYGGGALLDGSNLDPGAVGPTFKNCRFVNNLATGSGGAIGGFMMGAVIEDCVFEGNHSLGDPADPFDVSAGGGAVVAEGETEISGCTFISNSTCFGYGGGLAINEAFGEPLRIANCQFLTNEAREQGGGAYVDTPGSWFLNCLFAGNLSQGVDPEGGAAEGGGGVFSRIKLINCTVVHNGALNDDGIEVVRGAGALLTT